MAELGHASQGCQDPCRVYKACGGKWHQELELREEPKRKAGRMRERLEEAERKAERKIQMTRQVLLSLRGYTV